MGIYLLEREVGFHPTLLGFPSINNCLAVVLVTDNGLFGLHSNGANSVAGWTTRAPIFAQYVQQHFLRGPGTRLYGVTYGRGNRYMDYPGANWRADWIAEMTAYANALNFNGEIRGYDLTQHPGIGASAYVEYRRNGAGCDIWIKTWADADGTMKKNDSNVNHRRIGGNGIVNITSDIVSAVNAAGTVNVVSEQLRP